MNFDRNLFLPYQKRWLADPSPIKIWEKSRRIGATYVQAFEDVWDCVYQNVPAIWFSSADESAAREYIIYVQEWARTLHEEFVKIGEIVIDSERDLKAFSVTFANGTRIHAMSSNPKGFRSKGGKVVLDEFAWHENQDTMWSAALPCITWGFPLRILSTHNGESCRFYKLLQDARKKKKKRWSIHTTPLDLAVREGIVDKVLQRKASKKEKQEWYQEVRDDCNDSETWLQEYCCIPLDSTTAFMPYDLIESCESEDVLKNLDETTGDLFVGVDVGRKKDLTVIWALELLESTFYTRIMIVLEKTRFAIQKERLWKVLNNRRVRRCCIDETGIGIQLAEETQERFGKYKIEPISATNASNSELAFNLKTNFEDKTVYIPSDDLIREDLHSIKKITTAAGNIRFDANSTSVGTDKKKKQHSHADRFWSLALALHAGANNPGPLKVKSKGRRKSYELFGTGR